MEDFSESPPAEVEHILMLNIDESWSSSRCLFPLSMLADKLVSRFTLSFRFDYPPELFKGSLLLLLLLLLFLMGF